MLRTSSPRTYSRSESNSVPWPRTRTAARPSSSRSFASRLGRCLRESNGGSTRTRPATARDALPRRPARAGPSDRTVTRSARRSPRRVGVSGGPQQHLVARRQVDPVPVARWRPRTAARRRAAGRAAAGPAVRHDQVRRLGLAPCRTCPTGRRSDVEGGPARRRAARRRRTRTRVARTHHQRGARRSAARTSASDAQQQDERDPAGQGHRVPVMDDASSRDGHRVERALQHLRPRRPPRAPPRGAARAGARGSRRRAPSRRPASRTIAALQPGPGPAGAQQRGRAARADPEAQRRRDPGGAGDVDDVARDLRARRSPRGRRPRPPPRRRDRPPARTPAAAMSCGSKPSACRRRICDLASRSGSGSTTLSRNRSSCASGSG